MEKLVNQIKNADPKSKIGQFNCAINTLRDKWLKGGPNRGFKTPDTIGNLKARGRKFFTQWKAWRIAKKAGQLAAKVAAKAGKRTTGTLGKKVLTKVIPGVSLVFAIASWPSDVRAKGFWKGTANTLADGAPLVSTGKLIAETIAGADVFPDDPTMMAELEDYEYLPEDDAELADSDIASDDEVTP